MRNTRQVSQKKATQGYQRLKSGQPAKASSVRELIELYKAGKFEETLAKSEAMIKEFPKFTFILNISGVANSTLERYNKSIEAYRKALKLDPENTEFYGNMDNALLITTEFESAIRNFKSALRIDPNNS